LLLLSAAPAVANPPEAAYIEISDRWTEQVGLDDALERSGFSPVPMDLSSGDVPRTPLIVVGSFASESATVRQWLAENRDGLLERVAAGTVLLQWTQADQTEPTPRFLPESLTIRRTDRDGTPVRVLAAGHPLVASLPRLADQPDSLDLPAHHRAGSWETLRDQRGFRVLATLGRSTRDPVLVEAAHGRGRIVLTSLFFDKRMTAGGEVVAPAGFDKAANAFFSGLREYVSLVQSGAAPAVEATPAYQPPAPLSFVPGSSTIVALPDTQVYSERYPHHFLSQTRWIREHLAQRNIVAVFHEGDITNRNTPEQWEHAQRAMDQIFGRLPVIAAPGNHDMGPGGNGADHESLMSRYLDVDRFESHASFGGTLEPGRTENNYSLFEAGDSKWIGIALEWAPRERAVRWADALLTKHSDRHAILVTHAYMYFDDTKYDWDRTNSQSWSPYKYGVADGEEPIHDAGDLWEELIDRHDNVMMVLSGHVLGDGAGRLSEATRFGNVVHQMLANYQMLHEGGDGWLRLIEILPDGKTVQVRTFSPVLNRYNTDPEHQFTLELQPAASGPSN
jgi:hypothetical protein